MSIVRVGHDAFSVVMVVDVKTAAVAAVVGVVVE
jgi:type III secretory pathway component EscS